MFFFLYKRKVNTQFLRRSEKSKNENENDDERTFFEIFFLTKEKFRKHFLVRIEKDILFGGKDRKHLNMSKMTNKKETKNCISSKCKFQRKHKNEKRKTNVIETRIQKTTDEEMDEQKEDIQR